VSRFSQQSENLPKLRTSQGRRPSPLKRRRLVRHGLCHGGLRAHAGLLDHSPPFQGRRPPAFGVSEFREFILSPPARDAPTVWRLCQRNTRMSPHCAQVDGGHAGHRQLCPGEGDALSRALEQRHSGWASPSPGRHRRCRCQELGRDNRIEPDVDRRLILGRIGSRIAQGTFSHCATTSWF
jgi:hypothetical protein